MPNIRRLPTSSEISNSSFLTFVAVELQILVSILEPKKPSEASQLRAQTSREAPLVRGCNFLWLEDNGIVHLRIGTEAHRKGKPYTSEDALVDGEADNTT